MSADLADAKTRGVKLDQKCIRLINGRHVIPTIASPYLIELGPSAPRPVTGEAWLARRTE